MIIFCKTNDSGKIVAACEKDFPQPGWQKIDAPEDFMVCNAINYAVVDGNLVYLDTEEIDTTTKEPTPEERIAALEEELSATKILLGLEE